jgi:hypothetical protein
MTAQTEEGVRLRSTTPFLDVLTPRERRRLYEAFQAVPGKSVCTSPARSGR